MNDLYDDELNAEVKNYVLWCEGRLEELRRAGLVEGQSALTEAGWRAYRELVAAGFAPSKEKAIWTLQKDQHVPGELAEALAALMLRERA